MGSTLRTSKERSLLIGLVLTLSLCIIIFRLFWIQTVDSVALYSKAKKMWVLNEVLKPKRGTIYDRSHEQLLAWETNAYYFIADPKRIKDPKKTTDLLSPILNIPESDLYSQLTQKKEWVRLQSKDGYKYPEDIKSKVTQLSEENGIKGIVAYPDNQRKYIGMEAAQVLGFVKNDDNQTPSGGIESEYDNLLRGKQGNIVYTKSRDGVMISDKPEEYEKPVQGKDLVLTLDSRIQHQIEQELDNAISNYKAKGGTAIVADPKTGEILAMASRPSYDPNNYGKTWTTENSKNLAVQSQFEPGSTFKIVTLAAAIEEKIFHPDATFQSGKIQVQDRIIRDWNGVGWGRITFNEGVKKSSNVAFVNLGQQLGAQRLIEYIDRFGFGNITTKYGKKTGIDLPVEERGYFFGRSLYPSELATTAFGQGISVTPIQQVAAVSAIANGGNLIQPHILKEVWDPETNKRVMSIQPKLQTIIKPETAKAVRELLREVVKPGAGGTGVEADVPGYRVAGKTGTAQKPDEHGGYAKGKYVTSFIGFAPYDDPDIVVYVAIDEPMSSYETVSGGKVAAPIAREIFSKVLKIREIELKKSFNNEEVK